MLYCPKHDPYLSLLLLSKKQWHIIRYTITNELSVGRINQAPMQAFYIRARSQSQWFPMLFLKNKYGGSTKKIRTRYRPLMHCAQMHSPSLAWIDKKKHKINLKYSTHFLYAFLISLIGTVGAKKISNINYLPLWGTFFRGPRPHIPPLTKWLGPGTRRAYYEVCCSCSNLTPSASTLGHNCFS